jgi:hypothetical protein
MLFLITAKKDSCSTYFIPAPLTGYKCVDETSVDIPELLGILAICIVVYRQKGAE